MIERIFMKNPFFTMSSIFKYPDPKTTALGGVATGSIKAQEAAKVAPTNKKYGCTPTAVANDTNTGNNMAVVAKFDVISVKKLTDAIKINNNKISGTDSSAVI